MSRFSAVSDGTKFSYTMQKVNSIQTKLGKCNEDTTFYVDGLGKITLNGSVTFEPDAHDCDTRQ